MLEIAFREWAICFCFLKRSRSLLSVSDDGNKYNVLFNWPPSPHKMLNVGQKFIGYDLLWNDLPHSKGFMKFGYLEPSKIMFDFRNVLLVERRLTQFVRNPPYEISVFLTNFIFSAETK